MFYAEKLGWGTFPVGLDKNPLTNHGFKDATLDPAVMATWSRSLCGIGFAPASAWLVVLDVDLYKAPAAASWRQLQRDSGAGENLGITLTAITGSGGRHHYYRLAVADVRRVRTKGTGGHGPLGEAIDILWESPFCILPPSRNRNGVYRWSNWSTPIAALPPWISRCLLETTPAANPAYPPGAPQPEVVAIKVKLLARVLENLRWSGADPSDAGLKGRELCPVHGGGSPMNLMIKIMPDGFVMYCCWGEARCGHHEVAARIEELLQGLKNGR